MTEQESREVGGHALVTGPLFSQASNQTPGLCEYLCHIVRALISTGKAESNWILHI
jgi:hypothetical protein